MYIRDRRNLKFQILSDYTKQLLHWHGETVETLIKLKLLVEKKDNCDKIDLLVKLSSQIEKGRFFFPNIDRGDNFGKDKPFAYMGYRNLTLDLLVYSYNLFDKQECFNYLRHAELLQREFTSIVFEVVRPKDNLTMIKRLTDQYLNKDNIFDHFLDKNPESIKYMHR